MAVPSYFCPMLLSDPDRTAQYRRAIHAAVADFQRLNGRSPDVLDLGCGTGLLGLLAVEGGAASVTSIDLLDECISMSEATMAAISTKVWDVMHADDLDDDHQFDMIVSEMLGTLSFGEGGFDAVSEHAPRLRPDVVGGPYVIPRTATQTVALYSMPDLGTTPWLHAALKEVLRSQVRWVGTNSLNLHPACLGLEELAPPQPVYLADYAAGSEETMHARFTTVPPDSLLLCEWTATLWSDVVLRNTLDAYRSFPLANAVGRECAWGFVIAAPPPLPNVGVTATKNEFGDFVMEASAGDGMWSVKDVKVAEESVGALLGLGPEVERALDALPPGAEVLVETNECTPMVRLLEKACRKRQLPEPWAQDDVAASWTMANPIVRTGQPVDEPPGEGSLGLALLPDVLGECVTEAACRYNDERFAPEKPTHVQVLEMLRSLGGGENTPTIPAAFPTEPLEWVDVALPLDGMVGQEFGEALVTCLSAPLKKMQGYASLTRHGILGDSYMPGNYVQALPLLAQPCGRKRKKDAAAIKLRVASTAQASDLPSNTAVENMDPAQVRSVVAGLCTGGAAVVLGSL